MKFFKNILQLGLLGYLFSNSAWAQSESVEQKVSSEIQGYLQGLSSPNTQQVQAAAEAIAASGLANTELFDPVKDRTLEFHRRQIEHPDDEQLAEVGAALVRALGSSGVERYWPVLDQILAESPSRLVRHRAKQAQDDLRWYATRNNIMQDMSQHQEDQPLMATRYLNLLRDKDMRINRYALEELYRLGSADPLVMDWIWADFSAGIRTETDGLREDMLAWECRVIVSLAGDQYAEQVQTIAEDRDVPGKIRRHCANELER